MRLKTYSFLSAEFQRKLNKPSKREWMCFYCNDARAQKNIQDFKFATIDQMYQHWKVNHSPDARDAAAAAAAGAKTHGPFRFYAVNLLHCHMDSCGYYSAFQGLQRHHENKHKNDLFVPIMNGRCALCMYSGNGLREHSCSALQNGMQLKFYNPVLLTDQDLAEAQAVESQEMKQNRPKRIECQNCGNIFGTREEMTQHHHQMHG